LPRTTTPLAAMMLSEEYKKTQALYDKLLQDLKSEPFFTTDGKPPTDDDIILDPPT
jgi:hypothetical protein